MGFNMLINLEMLDRKLKISSINKKGNAYNGSIVINFNVITRFLRKKLEI
jgi:hypothetical protein